MDGIPGVRVFFCGAFVVFMCLFVVFLWCVGALVRWCGWADGDTVWSTWFAGRRDNRNNNGSGNGNDNNKGKGGTAVKGLQGIVG